MSPPSGSDPGPSAARRLRDALEPIAQQGWGRAVRRRLAGLGLDGAESYVWSRAAALGDPSPGVVVAAFGVFEPTWLAGVYQRARTQADRSAVLAAREAAAVDALSGIIPASGEVAWVADRLLEATGGLDPVGRPLFAGLGSVALPASPHGRLWRATDLVREHRGDSHLAVCVAAGLGAVEMNVLTETWVGYAPGEYTSTRGWGPAAVTDALGSLAARGWWDGTQLTAAGREARGAIERATDAAQERLVAGLGGDIERVTGRLAAMSERLIGTGAYTDDPRKRAAG